MFMSARRGCVERPGERKRADLMKVSRTRATEEASALPPRGMVERSGLQALGRRLRRLGLRVVFTNGCFDLLHIGHARYLEAARRLGDALVVGLNSDGSVRALKGPGRPVLPEAERAELLAALRCVDYVTLFDEPTPEAAISLLRPDFHVKGGDYRADEIPEAPAVVAGGGRVVIVPFVEGWSTTRLIERIQGRGQ
jgi:rfaE bifunctional protein nucleotidyltransferase chain/domain